jgi:hypothetical protein
MFGIHIFDWDLIYGDSINNRLKLITTACPITNIALNTFTQPVHSSLTSAQ